MRNWCKQFRSAKAPDFIQKDLLCNAYSNSSDEDEEEAQRVKQPRPKTSTPPNFKRQKPDGPLKHTTAYHPLPGPTQIPAVAQVAGRYISKRERALLASQPYSPNPNPVTAIPVGGSILDSDVRGDIVSLLRNKAKDRSSRLGLMPDTMSVSLSRHTKAVNALHWSPSHAHLLASASMDYALCIWNVWSSDQRVARVLSFHSAAIKDVKWSWGGLSVLSCGYDSSSRLVDVEKGVQTQVFMENHVVSVVKFHPNNPNLFISGGSKGGLKLWDIRNAKVVHQYIRGSDPILDIEFNANGKQVVSSSSDVSGRNLSANAIVVWDVSREVPLSNQVYVEAFTCPCVRFHPFEPSFVAQSNANYIAIFSASPPFKMNKYKRYESHGVSGFPIKCAFSLEGDKLVSGSSDGSIYFYDYGSSEIIERIKAFEQASIDIAVHPIISNVIASCSWNGEVSVFE